MEKNIRDFRYSDNNLTEITFSQIERLSEFELEFPDTNAFLFYSKSFGNVGRRMVPDVKLKFNLSSSLMSYQTISDDNLATRHCNIKANENGFLLTDKKNNEIGWFLTALHLSKFLTRTTKYADQFFWPSTPKTTNRVKKIASIKNFMNFIAMAGWNSLEKDSFIFELLESNTIELDLTIFWIFTKKHNENTYNLTTGIGMYQDICSKVNNSLCDEISVHLYITRSLEDKIGICDEVIQIEYTGEGNFIDIPCKTENSVIKITQFVNKI